MDHWDDSLGNGSIGDLFKALKDMECVIPKHIKLTVKRLSKLKIRILITGKKIKKSKSVDGKPLFDIRVKLVKAYEG